MIDRPRLIKLLMMTTSVNDAEALVAIRMANTMLKEARQDWQSLLGVGSSRPPVPPRPRQPSRPMGRGVFETEPPRKYTDPDIPRMLKSLLRDTKGSFRDFLLSIEENWNEKEYLTRGQYEALVNAYERAK